MEAARALETKKAQPAHPGGGDPRFKLTPELEAEAMDNFFNDAVDESVHDHALTLSAPRGTDMPTITAEDLELDRQLEQIAKQAPIDHDPTTVIVPEKKRRDLLRNFTENYKPADSIMVLDDQVYQAQQLDIDSIEGTEKIVKHFCKTSFKEVQKVGYFIYKNIRVYIDGYFEQNKDADKVTMEQRLHSGGAKIDLAPIITPQKV